MCGRNSLFAPPTVLEEQFGVTVPQSYHRQYNIAPGDNTFVLTNDTPERITEATWGFAPSWADSRLINARAETVAETAPFEEAWEQRPCLVLSSGFYEWQEQPSGGKQPYRVFKETEQPFAMAGLWEPTDTGITVTVLTTEPNETMAPLHHRMPVVLQRDAEDTWLTAGPNRRAELTRPYDGGDLTTVAISTAVNDPSVDTPSVIEPLETEQSGLGEFQ